jgi:glycosyltransferase involved in cell wall biosynthesis
MLNQEFKDFAFVIVDDGSVDKTSNFLDKKYSKLDPRITIIHNVTNKGLPAALNIGHAIGKAPYCTWISTDNISRPNHLRALYETMIKGDCDFVQSAWLKILESKEKTVVNSGKGKGTWGFGNLGPSFLYKREVWETYHYDEDAMLVEDLKFYLQACCHPFKFKCIDDCLVEYYYQPNSLTRRGYINKSHRQMLDSIYQTVIVPYLKRQ